MRTLLWFVRFIAYFLKVRRLENIYLKKLAENDLSKEDRVEIDAQIQEWAGKMLEWAGVKVEIDGIENIPKEVPCLFTPNHQGNFDIPLLIANLPELCAMVSKKEVKKIPLIEGWMRLFDCVFLDRGNARAALAVMTEIENVLAKGRSVVIFPEGTRSKGDLQNEFKHGGFRPALKGGYPIVPVAIEGSYRIMEANGGFIKPGTIKVRVLPAIITAELSKEEQKDIANVVFNSIQEARNVLKNEQ